jgi:hypothetical protein
MSEWQKIAHYGTLYSMFEALESLSNLNAEQLRQLAQELIAKLAQ